MANKSLHEKIPAGDKVTKDDEEILSDEQIKALTAIREGKSVFITGSAGVGKSYLLNKIMEILPENIGITASTGVAACNIGGTTLHSFAGIGLGEKPANVLVAMIRRYKQDVKRRWLDTDVLVVDEISMIDGLVFNKVDEVAQGVRGSSAPFGGMQVILCGDFLQLPPVNVHTFAFETNSWSKLIDETIVLKKVFRQKLVGTTIFPQDGIKPTRLYPHRWKVEEDNRRERASFSSRPAVFDLLPTHLQKLPGESFIYQSTDFAKNDSFRDLLQKNCKYLKELELKEGAQVMLLINKDVHSGLVNGSRGVVVGFQQRTHPKDVNDDDDDGDGGLNILRYPIVKFANGIVLEVHVEKITISVAGAVVAWRIQVPLALAWAVSIHKSQGMTLERVEVDIKKAFEHGQAYVALSRVTSLDGLLLRDFDPGRITAHPKVLQYYKYLDPTYDKSLKLGTEELEEFIKLRRDPERYKKLVADRVPIKCASDTDFKHNYFNKTIENGRDKVKLLRIECENVIESPGKSQYDRINGTCRRREHEETQKSKPSKTCSSNSPLVRTPMPKIDGDSVTYFIPKQTTLIKAEFNQNKPCSLKSPLATAKPVIDTECVSKPSALNEAEIKLKNCRSMLSEIQYSSTCISSKLKSNIRTDLNNTPLKDNILNNLAPINVSTPVLKYDPIIIDSDSDSKESKSTYRPKRISGKKRKSYCEMVQDNVISDDLIGRDALNPVIDNERTIIEESDPEDLFESSVYKKDNNLVPGPSSRLTFNSLNSSQPLLQKGKETPQQDFLSNICPDLLVMSQGGSKRQKIDPVIDENARIQTLLKEKKAHIQENRRKALEKRLISLKRKSML